MSPFVPKDWQDAPSTQTPISAAALEDLEARVAGYTDTRFNTGNVTQQHVYVSKQGNDSTGNGLSWGTAFLTIGRAITALGTNPGQINIGPGVFAETVTLANEGQCLNGTTRRFLAGTVMQPPTDTAGDIITITAPADCRVENIAFQSIGNWNGIGLNLVGAGYVLARQLLFRSGFGTATATRGGTCIKIQRGEGSLFQDIGFSDWRLSLDIDNGANQNTFVNLHSSFCWQDLWVHDSVGDNNPGGNAFWRFKSVGGRSGLPVLLDTTSNGNLFIQADWNESDQHTNPSTGQLEQIVQIKSHHNTFVMGSTSPQTTWQVTSNNNHFHHLWVGNSIKVTGNNNYLDRPHLVGSEVTINGTGNFLENPSKGGQVATPGFTVTAGNYIENTEGVSITGTGYHQRAYVDQITGGGGGGTPGHSILDETTALTQRAGLAFQGAGVTATDDSANNRTVVSIPGASGGTTTTTAGVTPARSQGLVLEDTLTPVTADGVGLGIGQCQGSPTKRFFIMSGNFRQVVGIMGSDVLGYTPGSGTSSMIRCSVAVWLPGSSVWSPTHTGTTTADQDKFYGQPGVSCMSTRLGLFSASAYRRLLQRWYKIPGYPDLLFLEIAFTIDRTATDGTAISSKFAGSGASPYAPRFSLSLEAQPWSSSGGIALGYDSTLDAISVLNGSGSTDGGDYTYHMVKCVSDPSTGYFYDQGTLDPDQNFASGALPAGSTYTTTGSTTYRAHLSTTPTMSRDTIYYVRYAVSVGTTVAAAKRLIQRAPNQGPDATIAYYEQQVGAAVAPSNLSASEKTAFSYFALPPALNARKETDWLPEQGGWDGTPRRLPFTGLGRWNAVWTFDNSLGYMGFSELDPVLVRDFLDFLLNGCMNQSNGFLRRDPTVDGNGTTTGETSVGNFHLARLTRRYLAATGNTTFVTALYPKLQLLYNWWTITANASQYRHPSWPTVKLLRSKTAEEVQELSPVTSGGNYPAGDDWLTSMAYDFCVHMAYLASVTGHGGDVATWNSEATAYRNSIRTYCWDVGQGWFQPVMTPTSPSGGQSDSLGRFQAVRTYRAFPHVWTGVASPSHASTMRSQIMDSNIFLGTYGVRTVDKRWGGYNPNDWVNGGSRPYFDTMCSVGFRRYGFNIDADTILQKWVNRQIAVGTSPEMTNPDTGIGGFARFMIPALMVIEAMLAKNSPSMLGVDTGVSTAIGLDAVTT